MNGFVLQFCYGLSAGLIFATLGYALVAVIGAALSFIPIFFSIRMLVNHPRTSDAQV